MIHLGDITKINGAAVEPVDVITGGSPCQDLSAAGKRQGLAGARSGLFMEQIRIIKEMRCADEQRGRTGVLVRPRYMVWENVPGAFSSNKNEDFRAVLEETAKIVCEDAVIPKPPKGKWSNSGCIMGDGWSIAWRVLDAQFWGVPQRRRRIALVADFGGQSAPEILFVRKSVSGDIEESRTAWERAAGDVENCVGIAISNRGIVTGEIVETLRAESHGALPMFVSYGFKHNAGAKAGSIGWQYETAPTLSAAQECAVFDCRGNGVAKVAVALENHPADSRVKISEDNKVQTLTSRMGTGGGNVPMLMVYGICSKGSNAMKSDNPRSGAYVADTSRTLDANGGNPACNQGGMVVVSQKAVRRFTPLECERLQGYPDNWTLIPDYIDGKGKMRKVSDTARYKALGNSIALPQWKWVLKRISAQYERDATLGSLFDGIGGFPLCWEQINGLGSAKWASEIEEFPIAVTKYRFGG